MTSHPSHHCNSTRRRRDAEPSQWDTDDHGLNGSARIIAIYCRGGVGVGRTATTADSGARIERGVRDEHLNQQLAAPTARRLRLGFAPNLFCDGAMTLKCDVCDAWRTLRLGGESAMAPIRARAQLTGSFSLSSIRRISSSVVTGSAVIMECSNVALRTSGEIPSVRRAQITAVSSSSCI